MNKQQILLNLILQHEGGYSNNPHDLGGRTYCGISENNFPQWPGWGILDSYSLKYNQVLDNEQLTELVHDFYTQNFYTPMMVENLDSLVLSAHYYDCGVNCGIRTAVKMLQRSINQSLTSKIAEDGYIGSITISEANTLDPFKLVDAYVKEREGYYKSIVDRNPSQEVFLEGWLNRIYNTTDYIFKYVEIKNPVR